MSNRGTNSQRLYWLINTVFKSLYLDFLYLYYAEMQHYKYPVAMQLLVNNVCYLLSIHIAKWFLPNQRYWTRLSNSLDTLIQLIGHVSPTHWTNVSKVVCYVSFRKNLLRSCRNMSSIGSEIPTCILPTASVRSIVLHSGRTRWHCRRSPFRKTRGEPFPALPP